jgi:hypothetical protein
MNFEQALRRDFSGKPDVAKLQRLALAHIDAERELEQRVDGGDSALTAAFLLVPHLVFDLHLATDQGSGTLQDR